jgi:nitric oxide reductase subunit B
MMLSFPGGNFTEPKGQLKGAHLLFFALMMVVAGTLLGEMLGRFQLLGELWLWIDHQDWEYLDLGRGCQVLLAIGLVFWLLLVIRGIGSARKVSEERKISFLFSFAAPAFPLLYLPAMFFGSTTHFSVVDTWRFWIIHLRMKGFFEIVATVMVSVLFYKVAMVSNLSILRVTENQPTKEHGKAE